MFKPARTQRCRSAFTLVEILIVLAITGVLAAILLPVFNSARNSSRTTSCASNLRQIGVAMQLYVNDYQGFYPSYHPGKADCTWADRMFPYLKTEKVLWCPAFDDGEYRTGCTAPEEINGVKHFYNGSYDLNTLEDAVSEIGRTAPCVPEMRVRFPAQTILLLDGNNKPFANISAGQYAQMTSLKELAEKGVPDRHQGGNNMLFADWHVKWKSLPSLLERNQWRASGNAPVVPTTSS